MIQKLSTKLCSHNGLSLYDVIESAVRATPRYKVVGLISEEPIITSKFDLVQDADGFTWSYLGSLTQPMVVSSETVPNDKEEWQAVVISSITAKDRTSLGNTTITNVEVAAPSVKYTVNSADGFTVGKYALIHATNRLGLIYCGVYKVQEVGSDFIRVLQSNTAIHSGSPLGTVYASPLNTVLRSANGILVDGQVETIEGLVIDGLGRSKYGLRLGGLHSAKGYRPVGFVSLVHRVGVVNLNTTDGPNDDTVGFLAANGSVMGVNKIAVNTSKIGIEAYRNSTIIGEGAFVSNCTNDAFKTEFTCNSYLLYCTAAACSGAGYSARYSAGGEFGTMVAIDCAYGAIAQFNAYTSVRDFYYLNCSVVGNYATDSSYLYQRGGLIKDSAVAMRVTQGSSMESAGTLSVDFIEEKGNAAGFDVQNSSLRHNTRKIVGDVPSDTWDGKNEVIVNNVNPGVSTQEVTTTINPGSRAAYVLDFPVAFPMSQAYKVICADATLQSGLLVDAQPYSVGRARLYINNVSSSPKELTNAKFLVKAIG